MKLRIAALCALALGLGTAAIAADKFPDRTVTLLSTFPPGGVADTQGRPLAAALERVFGQPVVLQSKAGGGGSVGWAFGANAKPDGYTGVLGIVSISSHPVADKLFGRKPSYTLDDYIPIARVTADPMYVAVQADSKWKNLRELLEDVKANPGKLTYSSSGPYGATHLPTEMIVGQVGGKVRHIPTTGGGPALRSLLGGHVDFTMGGPSALTAHLKAGKVRVFGGTGLKRHPLFPDVPTANEEGVKMDYYLWLGVFLQKGTPEPIVTAWRGAIRKAIDDAGFKDAMRNLNAVIDYQDQPEFTKWFATDAAAIAKVVQSVGRIETPKPAPKK
jgi:tripartite-type tricarboxylate transporter receptor subunit TctC